MRRRSSTARRSSNLSARTGSDYGLDAFATGFQHLLPVDTVNLTLWGVPADPRTTSDQVPLRLRTGLGDICADLLDPNEPAMARPVASDAPTIPFLQNPTTCGVPLTATVDVLSYDGETTHAEAPWPATTGCEQLAFNPSLTAQPTTTQADTPVRPRRRPQGAADPEPDSPSPSELAATTVTLPEGFSINPNAADGKVACTRRAGALRDRRCRRECPEFSKVGTLEIDSSALPGRSGAIYLGEPQPGQPYRIFLTADGFGTHVKLPGSVHPDPRPGSGGHLQRPAAVAVPGVQLPLLRLRARPARDADPVRHLRGRDRIRALGRGPLEPDLDELLHDRLGPERAPLPGRDPARSTRPSTRAPPTTPPGITRRFSLRLSRADGDQNLTGSTSTTPPGLRWRRSQGIPYCPESALATLAEPGYSGIAELARAGLPGGEPDRHRGRRRRAPGTHPLYVAGQGLPRRPLQGRPAQPRGRRPGGLRALRPRQRRRPRRRSSSTRSPRRSRRLGPASADPRRDPAAACARSLIDLDRPDFTLNPTNCDPFRSTRRSFGNQGGDRRPDARRFQVANCADLGYGPKLGLKLTGGDQTARPPGASRRRSEPSRAKRTSQRSSVTLPKGELLDNAHIGTICTRVQFAAGHLPGGVGLRPARRRPRRCSTSRSRAPSTCAPPNTSCPTSSPTSRARSTSSCRADRQRQERRPAGHLRAVPDAPVSTFVLRMQGGKKGLLVNSESLCSKPQKADVKMVGQNGAALNRKTKLQVACGDDEPA